MIMTVNKNINHIMVHGNRAYLSCNFGIIVLNLQRREIAEVYYIGEHASEVNVINTTVHENEIYALTTDNRLFKANLSNPNLVDFRNWSQVPNLPGSTRQAIASFAGRLFIQSDWKLFIYDNGNWNAFILPNNDAVTPGISVSQGKMMVANERNNIYIIDESLNPNNTIHLQNVVAWAHAGVFDSRNNTYWFAGGERGVVSYNSNTAATNTFIPSGPTVNTPWNLTFAGEKLFVVPGSRWAGGHDRPGIVMIFENGIWTNISNDEIRAQSGITYVLDFVNVAVDPTDNSRFFVTSHGTGLYEFRDNRFFRWHYELAPISGLSPQRFTRLDGAIFDSQGNLFVANSMVVNGIEVLLANGKWIKLSYPGINQNATLGTILINQRNQNQKWVLGVRHNTAGVGVFDDNGTITDQNDDKSRFMSSFTDTDGEIVNPAIFYSIAQDHNGVIWVGTDKGPILFPMPNNTDRVFDSDYRVSRVKIPRNDGTTQADYLLAEERVKAIAIDGANRKWLGTENSGVYLMSENGQETIQHFTTDNSPLLSNDILSIAINPVSGEVFLGTGAGLVSFQSDAAHAGRSFGNVYAYPNPVRQNFHGVITITGLIHNTQVKITDVNGNLIAQTVSNGSIATWDGRDGFGQRVSTGIYFAMCITEDGKESTITKIMVIN
jgi:ligand-binding sensor domain-containing protein